MAGYRCGLRSPAGRLTYQLGAGRVPRRHRNSVDTRSVPRNAVVTIDTAGGWAQSQTTMSVTIVEDAAADDESRVRARVGTATAQQPAWVTRAASSPLRCCAVASQLVSEDPVGPSQGGEQC